MGCICVVDVDDLLYTLHIDDDDFLLCGKSWPLRPRLLFAEMAGLLTKYRSHVVEDIFG